MLLAEPLTDRVIGLAIEVHRHTGPGLLESVYEMRLCRELANAVSTILPIHAVQLRTYLRMSGIHVGLLPNFNVPRLVDGLRRYVV